MRHPAGDPVSRTDICDPEHLLGFGSFFCHSEISLFCFQGLLQLSQSPKLGLELTFFQLYSD